jgi:hypothetical protein
VVPLSSYLDRLLQPAYATLPPGGAPAHGLPARAVVLYRDRLAMSAEFEKAAITRTVEGADEPAARYLRRAFAAGTDVVTVERLAAAWAAWGPERVRQVIGRFDEPTPGPVPGPGRERTGRLVQCDGTTCGATVIVVARMIADPAFAHHIATAPAGAFGAAQLRVQRAANVVWPRAFGVTPAGLTAVLNLHSGLFGARYGTRPVDPTRPDRVRAALGAAAASVTAGWPVPLLVGKWEPRHWVLVVGATGDTLLCYEPTRGRIGAVTVEDLAAGRAKGLGYPNLHALVYPVRHA